MHTPLLLSLLVACGPDPRVITDPDAELRAVIDGNNAFAWDLHRAAAASDNGNLFYSPLSISAAFAMAYAGARGETADEMASVLHIDSDDGAFHEEFGALLSDLSGSHGRPYELRIANRLFGQDGFPFVTDFLSVCSDAYDAPLEQLDFAANAEGARDDINGWVEHETDGRIKDLLPPGSTDGARLVVANAIAFEGSWRYRFARSDTKEEPFRLASGDQVSVPTMQQIGSDLRMARDEGVSMLQLPYDGDELSMVVLLPDDANGLPALEAQIEPAWVDELVAGAAPQGELEVWIPKLHLEPTLPLKALMQGLGMTTAFGNVPEVPADFSGIVDPAVESLHISDAFHKAFVDIDESGTEAAAATAVVIVTTTSVSSGPPAFHADHPFLFLIRDDLTGSILFIGRVVDPR